MIKTGTYKALIKGVSQQTPQEREDGQLSAQTNMLSDIVNGLRRRSGTKVQAVLDVTPDSYFNVLQLNSEYYIQSVTKSGVLRIHRLSTGALIYSDSIPYLVHTNKSSIRTTVTRNQSYIMNTSKIPVKTPIFEPLPDINPKIGGWFRIQTGAFSKQYSITIAQGLNPTLTYSVTTHATDASKATAEYIVTQLLAAMNVDSQFTTRYTAYSDGQVVAIRSNTDTDQLVITDTGGDTYITSSNASNTANKNLLPPSLPAIFNGYMMSVGTGENLAYYRYNYSTRNWAEVGEYETRYIITNTPIFWYFDYDLETVVLDSLDIQGRSAGNESNNPEPKFMNFGFTGISAYQSRLVLLSGAYVNFSKSSDPSVFMRTTVTELLDDDPIEVSATSLSNAQFEYAVPYNKDLIVIAQNQQAVIPNSSTVLTPKTAAIYPTTNTDISLACQPTVIARSLYYVYQRDLDYYQVGEFLPSPYTDSQYTTQSTTDHLPLYAESVCNCMSGSTASNVACFTSDTEEVLINQFYWRGDERPLMSYHKWVLPRNVVLNAQVSSSMLFLVADGTKTVVINTDIQLNQLQTKPIPYLDLYQYVTITDGVGVKPTYLPDGDLIAVIYDNVNNRHSEVAYSIEGDQVLCKYNGVIAIGLRYLSEFTLTPPYLRDANGNVVAGSKTTLQSLNFTTRGTGKFSYSAVDAYGGIEDSETSGATWSEIDLGYTWIGSVSNNIVTCRSKLNSTRVTLRTDSTTDLNITMAEYNLRIPDREVKRRR